MRTDFAPDVFFPILMKALMAHGVDPQVLEGKQIHLKINGPIDQEDLEAIAADIARKFATDSVEAHGSEEKEYQPKRLMKDEPVPGRQKNASSSFPTTEKVFADLEHSIHSFHGVLCTMKQDEQKMAKGLLSLEDISKRIDDDVKLLRLLKQCGF